MFKSSVEEGVTIRSGNDTAFGMICPRVKISAGESELQNERSRNIWGQSSLSTRVSHHSYLIAVTNSKAPGMVPQTPSRVPLPTPTQNGKRNQQDSDERACVPYAANEGADVVARTTSWGNPFSDSVPHTSDKPQMGRIITCQ